MSSTTNQQDSLFKTYLLNQNEPEEEEATEDKPAEQTSAWEYHEDYTPRRANFHTIRGKIKRYFA